VEVEVQVEVVLHPGQALLWLHHHNNHSNCANNNHNNNHNNHHNFNKLDQAQR